MSNTPRTNIAAYNGGKYLLDECAQLERELTYLAWRGHHMEADLGGRLNAPPTVWRVIDLQERTVGEGHTIQEALYNAMSNEGEANNAIAQPAPHEHR